MNIKPIKNHEDYKAALSRVDELSDAQIGTERFDTLDIIVTLIEAYEAKVYPIGPPDPIAAIEYEMEKRGLTRLDLEKVIGPSGRVSEVLSRRRPLSMSMIRRLHSAYQIRLDILIATYPLDKTTEPKKPHIQKSHPRQRVKATV